MNPWSLQSWLGHVDINQTLRYVHHAKAPQRPIPTEVLTAGESIRDPDDRVTAMLGALSGTTRGKNHPLPHLTPTPLGFR